MIRFWLIACLAVTCLWAAEQRGTVEFGGLPVPGAVVTATRDGQSFTAITDERGIYVFPDLADGTWTMLVEMQCFTPVTQEVAVAKGAPPSQFELKLLPMDQIKASPMAALPPPAPSSAPNPSAPKTQQAPPPAPEDLSQQATDGLLVNGSVNNGASSPFAQFAAFGNARQGSNALFTGGLGLIVDNSTLDARPFSLTGQDTGKPSYNHLTAVANLGGVLKIPHLMPKGVNFFVGYQWTRKRDASTQPGLVPDGLLRDGQFPTTVLDPSTNAPFPGNQIPKSRISPQAQSLLSLYPLPNFTGSTQYNYQIPLVDSVHQNALQSRLDKTLNNKNQLYGGFGFQDAQAATPNLFNFLDTNGSLGLVTSINWQHTLRPRLYANLGFQFSRLSTRETPFFENRTNISGDAGITGNLQDAMNWGPPSLTFASGIYPLSDAQASFNRDQTSGVSYSILWSRGGHDVTFGGDFRRQEFNYLAQQNPRGSFTFTGATTRSDFADFLLGVPDTSSIAFGNADKYFRASQYDGYINDDWRIGPQLTVNAGLRWEYGSPITELYGRLVNLDIAPGYSAVAPVVANSPVGSLTGEHYPNSLVRPDKHGFEPRIGIAWRPISGSSLVVRAGYGVAYNTSVYQSIASLMAQQEPLSKSLTVENSAADPLTLANGFNASPATTPQTFAIDPNFRVGYVQNWKVSMQRDLPASLIVTGTYLGTKGTRGMQEFLPNTYPTGAADPCPSCPRGFTYLASNGNSTREAGQVQLRRRLHSGLTATLEYTYAKAIDDSALGGRGTATYVIAQNWLDLSAERALSNFDQRHLSNAQVQYTTGMGAGGGALVNGWKGALFKEWVVSTQITAGSGLPLTPFYLNAVSGTGVTGVLRPDYTGAPLYTAPSGLYLNPAAFVAPPSGEWGDAGRNSVRGPSQCSVNASLGRTFRLKDRLNLHLRFDATNALNHVSYTGWNTTITSAQFGLPTAANAMRSIQTTLRLRF